MRTKATGLTSSNKTKLKKTLRTLKMEQESLLWMSDGKDFKRRRAEWIKALDPVVDE